MKKPKNHNTKEAKDIVVKFKTNKIYFLKKILNSKIYLRTNQKMINVKGGSV